MTATLLIGVSFPQKLADVDAPQGEAENPLEMVDHRGLHVLQVNPSAEGFGLRPHDASVVAARTDLEELPEGRRYVDDEPARCHPPPHLKSDRCASLASDPHASVPLLPAR